MSLTNEQLMAAAKAELAKVCNSTGNPILDIAIENIFMRGFSAGGQYAAANIMKRATDDMTNAAVNRIIKESK